ncbi:MAG: serine hydrolase [Clostridia bacterium]|nr:serine hydrolase [Clostridia bacterium]
MFEKITPETAGLPSDNIRQFIDMLNNGGCVTHDILLMKGDKIFAEYYWKPFNKDFLHRQYSQTKSFVSIGIGLLIDDGKLSLDDTVISHFPEKIDREIPENLAKQTIRDMLTMCTCGAPQNYWFGSNDPDRTHQYINEAVADHTPGLRWTYDSAGSQVLSSLVEKLSGMPLLDFLKCRIFNKTGTFKTARILKCKNNDSWGDSAMLCTARDMASFGRFVMNYGKWNGEQLLSESYLREAVSPLVNNSESGFDTFFGQGYGYQIWCTYGGFAFVGMGDQLTVCIPDKDLIFVINSDNQGYPSSRSIIMSAFFEKIVNPMSDTPLPVSEQADIGELKLAGTKGKSFSPMMKSISNKIYICQDNRAGIEKFFFVFDEKGGEWHYTNAQGDKVLPFFWNENCFFKFPQDGYSTEHGGLKNNDGYRYNCATSAAWRNDRQMTLRCQIIDDYFGNFTARFGFNDKEADVTFSKCAEAFLDEYTGTISAKQTD